MTCGSFRWAIPLVLCVTAFSQTPQQVAAAAKSLEEYEPEHQERQLRQLTRKARELGYELVKPGQAEPDPLPG